MGFTNLSAQGPAVPLLSTANGLPSNRIYKVMQDRRGMLWIGTEMGLVRYDGHRIQVWDAENGLPGRDVLGMHEDAFGRIWAFTFSGGFGYVDGERFHVPENIPFPNGVPTTVATLSDGRMVFASFTASVIWDPKTGDSRSYPQGVGRISVLLDVGEGNPNVVEFSNKEYKLGESKKNARIHNDLPEEWAALLASYPNRNIDHARLDALKADAPFVNSAIRRVEQECAGCNVFAMCYDRDSSLWLGTRAKGLYCLDRRNGRLFHQLSNSTVNHLVLTRSGHLLVATDNEGLFLLSPKSAVLEVLEKEDGLLEPQVIKIAATQEGDLLMAHPSGALSWYSPSGKSNRPQPPNQNSGLVMDLSVLPNGAILQSTDDSGIFIPLAAGNSTEIHFIPRNSGKAHLALGDSLWLFSTAAGLFECRPVGSEVVAKQVLRKRLDVLAMEEGSGRIWISVVDSLMVWERGKLRPIPDQGRLKSRISCLAPNPGGGMWVGTTTNGVFLFGVGPPLHFDRKDGLISNVCTALRMGPSGTLWVGTPKGLTALKRSTASKYLPQSLTTAEGLPDNHIFDVLEMGSHVYAATGNGLARFPSQELPPPSPPPCLGISQVRIVGQDTLVQAHYTLAHWQNTLALQCYDSCFKATQYAFRCIEMDSHWTKLSSPDVFIPYLAPGKDYHIQVRAANAQEQWSAPVEISLSIRQVFYRSTWFPIALAFVLLGIAVPIFAARQRQRQRIADQRAEFKRQLIDLKVSALKSQMNPHFIFNCLHSIQHLVLENKERKTLDFVSRFAQLMRRILDLSQADFCTLAAELSFCQQYLELESLRLSGNFSYDIDLPPSLDTQKILVPTVLFQPFLENAIWHGLQAKAGEGHLQVRVLEGEAVCSFVVEDNGIGRAAAKKLQSGRSSQHRSHALANFHERIRLLNQTCQGSPFAAEIEDLFDAAGKPSGTRVTVHFPKIFDAPYQKVTQAEDHP